MLSGPDQPARPFLLATREPLSSPLRGSPSALQKLQPGVSPATVGSPEWGCACVRPDAPHVPWCTRPGLLLRALVGTLCKAVVWQ